MRQNTEVIEDVAMSEDVVREKLRNRPLSSEEASAWELMVEEGRTIRAPIVAAQEARRAKSEANLKASCARSGRKYCPIRKGEARVSMTDVPVSTKRWVILRVAGVSFKRAGEQSGATWIEIQDAKAHSEEFRCAFAYMEENSRQLMKAKAQSIVEQSQEEGTRVSMAQTQVSLRILEGMDREHFGDAPRERGDGAPLLAGGGFLINLIQDAAKAADAPVKPTGKALVYSNV